MLEFIGLIVVNAIAVFLVCVMVRKLSDLRKARSKEIKQ